VLIYINSIIYINFSLRICPIFPTQQVISDPLNNINNINFSPLAYLLTAIAGYDKNDKYTAEIPWTVKPDYVGACKLGGLKGVKVGVLRELFDYSGPADGSLFNSAGTIATPGTYKYSMFSRVDLF
jgi:hypothetical protein